MNRAYGGLHHALSGQDGFQRKPGCKVGNRRSLAIIPLELFRKKRDHSSVCQHAPARTEQRILLLRKGIVGPHPRQQTCQLPKDAVQLPGGKQTVDWPLKCCNKKKCNGEAPWMSDQQDCRAALLQLFFVQRTKPGN